MGVFTVEIGIGDPDGLRFESVEAMVDSGASYTMIPSSLLRSLGVTPLKRRGFKLAGGSRIELENSQTWMRVEGELGIAPVVFVEEDAQPLLGAVTLEMFQLGIDPVEMQLVPVDGLLGSAGGYFR